MEKKVIKLKDLKSGMRLRSVKNVYYINRDNLEEGLMLEEELRSSLGWIIEIGKEWGVLIEDGEVFLIDENEESNEGFFDIDRMLEKGVFEII
jgi:hypothetical protein